MSVALRQLVGISTVGLGLAVIHYALKLRAHAAKLRDALSRATDELDKERTKRQSERKGRIRAEQELRTLAVQQSLQQPTELQPSVFPFKAIGTIHSCFNQRNGTPRQPLLVPAARSCLKLAPDIPPSCLEGLQGFSHCWVLYVFHCNTDLAKSLGPNRSAVKGKINVPRLDGGRCGVLATRTPHRPCPIGLSTARILGVEGGRLLLGGADIVDGSPVLDIKPYLPFCDSLPGATAPPWVKEEAEDEPLRVGGVAISESARQQLHSCWEARRSVSLYPDAHSFVELVQQVLSRDIRSVHQRRMQPTAASTTPTTGISAGNSATSSSTAGIVQATGTNAGLLRDTATPAPAMTTTTTTTTDTTATTSPSRMPQPPTLSSTTLPETSSSAQSSSSSSSTEHGVSRSGLAAEGAADSSSSRQAYDVQQQPSPEQNVSTHSLHSTQVHAAEQSSVEAAAGDSAGMGGGREVMYHVLLDGVDVQYRVRDADGVVEVVLAA